MPLRDALNFGGVRSDDPAPITGELISNITRILGEGGSEPDPYDMGAVFTGIVYALRRLEINIGHTNELLAALIKSRESPQSDL